MARQVTRDEHGKPFSKWKPADKFQHVMEMSYPYLEGMCQREFQFCPERRWRFDFCWPEVYLAVEIDGFGFGHQAQQNLAKQNEKQNHAICMDWYVLRFNSRQLGSLAGVNEALDMTWALYCELEN